MRFYLHRIDLNKSGYDTDGRYFGIGKPLYFYTAGEGKDYLRANDRMDAMKKIRAKYPSATFFRSGYLGRA